MPANLTRTQQKQIKAVVDRAKKDNGVPQTAQQSIPLYNALLEQEEKEARHVATALEIYVKGSLNLFNHRTNVDIHNRLVCYDIKQLGKQLKKIGMLVVQDQVWGRVTTNRNAGKATRYYMDEFHLLLKEEQTTAYSVEIWKRFRKWGGIPTGITQNVKDMLRSPEIANILENSDFIYIFSSRPEIFKALLDSHIFHGRNPKSLKRLSAPGFVVHQTEDQFSLTTGICCAHKTCNIFSGHEPFQDTELLLCTGGHFILPVRREDRQASICPFAVFCIVGFGLCQLHQMTDTPTDDVAVAFQVAIFTLGST